ncbi:hypothetical protein KBY96_08700 [Cyanobium sp. ATX 6A2]|uniref:hypothetical protein n=1 Tax=Cyanobium sp. ATX 6A2 TaxID=2823700 RepID=UPI0020CCD0FE|nr:hypothetical protein [Cyanobium sp. ATX 6A2]MCP9888005.1 hypothetical protein [Cyanobium sp. ATX 6A2]
MAALVFVLLITMATYAWLATPFIEVGTGVLQGAWLLWLPLLALLWLLAGRD